MYELRNLRRIRELKGLSGRQLAKLSEVNRKTISDLERLERRAQSDTVGRLARALKVHRDKLTGRPLPEVSQIACPDFAECCIDGADYLDTAETYEMGECVVLRRMNRSGWVVTLFHPQRFPARVEQEDAWDSLIEPGIPYASGLIVHPRPWPEEAPELTGRWGVTGNEPYRSTMVQPRPIPREEYEAAEESEVDENTVIQIDGTGLHMSSSSNMGGAFEFKERTNPLSPLAIYYHMWEQERVPFFFPDWVREKYPLHVFVWDEIVYRGDGSWQTLRLTLG